MTEMTDELALGRIVLALKPEHRERAESAIEHIAARLRAAPQPLAGLTDPPDPIGDIKRALEGREGWHDLSAKVQRKGDTLLIRGLCVQPPAEAQAVAEVRKDRCGCHPETCSCYGYSLWLNGRKMVSGQIDNLQHLATAINRTAPSAPYQDAYEGAREDLLDWKRRAQRAESTLRGLGYKGIDASEPPSAPVGVEAVLAKLREALGADGTVYQQAEGMILTLAQQPASDGGFTAADMMDARQEGRKEAQQPAAVDAAWQKQLADALDYFWNAAIRGAGDGQGNVIGGMVEGFAAVAEALRKHAPQQGDKA